MGLPELEPTEPASAVLSTATLLERLDHSDAPVLHTLTRRGLDTEARERLRNLGANRTARP